MTPAEIKVIHGKVTQKSVEAFAIYMDSWMKSNGQPDRDFHHTVAEMQKDKTSPDLQMLHLLGTLHTWFAYGN